MIDYEMVKKHFADKLAADFAGQGRFESAFYHTVKMVHDTVSDYYAGRIASLQSCYDTLLNNAADAHERIAGLEADIKTLRTALATTGAGNAQLLAALKGASESLGRFTSDEGWGLSDMNCMDNADAIIAKAEAGHA